MIDSAGLSDQVDNLEKQSQRFESPCGDGSLIIRRWPGPNEAADSVILVHGGSGSWRHWYNNIEYLSHRFHVYAIDLPGLGDSEALSPGYSAMDAVEVVSTGIQLLPGFGKFHLVAFSWGCAVSSQIVRLHEEQLLSLLLVGPASIGDIPRRGLMKPLLKRHLEMKQEEVYSANKENLARLMIHRKTRIDDMAVYIQTQNTNRARFNSPQFARSTLVLDGVRGMKAPLKVIYGEHDAPGLPDIEGKETLFQKVKPDVQFEIVPDAGHWLQYERSEIFNKICEQWLTENRAGR